MKPTAVAAIRYSVPLQARQNLLVLTVMAPLDKFYCEDFFLCNSDNFALLQQSFTNFQSFCYKFEEKNISSAVIHLISDSKGFWKDSTEMWDKLGKGVPGETHSFYD